VNGYREKNLFPQKDSRNFRFQKFRGLSIAIDCGALPKELAEVTAFRATSKRAFTGGIGIIKQDISNEQMEGTIFRTRLGESSAMKLQIQLLRAIQERTIRKIGGNKEAGY